MGSTAPCPTLLKVWISWLKGGLLLRVFGIPVALLALHLELYGSSPKSQSLILHRLSRRLRLQKLACRLGKKNEASDSITNLKSLALVDRAKVAPRARQRPTPNLLSRKRSKTPDNKDRTRRPSLGASPTLTSPSPKSQLPLPLPLPSPLQQRFEVIDAPASPSSAPPATPSPNPRPRPLPVELADAPSSAPVVTPAPLALPTPQPTPIKHFEPATPTPQTITAKPAQVEPTTRSTPLPNSSASVAPPAPLSTPQSSLFKRIIGATAPAFRPVAVKPVEVEAALRTPLPNSSASIAPPTPLPTPQPSPVKILEATAPTPEPIFVKPVEIEAPPTPLPNSSAARASLTPKPQSDPVEAPSVPQVEAPIASLPVSVAPTARRPPLPQLPPTALELEIFKAQLRSGSPATPCPDRRPLPVGRSNTADARLSNKKAFRASWTPKSQQSHPADAEAFENFKALLRGTPSTPAFPFPDCQSPLQTVQNSDDSEAPSLTSSTAATNISHTTPSTPMHASRPSTHSRSMSHASGVSRSSKRLSLQFPIQPSPTFTPKLRPQSWVAAPSPMSPPVLNDTPTESDLLALLAAQERYVLELKEELASAEKDLTTLKKHYANNEIVKRRDDTRRITKLQPLNTSLANFRVDADDEDGSNAWLQQEVERRKALLSNSKANAKNPPKVFSGSRHLRTLSLLSPDTMTAKYSPSFPQPQDIRDGIDESVARPHTLIRHATTPDLANHIADTIQDDQFDLGGLSNVQRDAILRTGKKMATDFKDGLFNFIEDIRQATVGDEAVDNAGPASAKGQTKNTRKPSEGRPGLNRASSSKKLQKTDAIADDFWKEHGLSEPKSAPATKITHAVKNARTPQKSKGLEEFEDWDNWDTPDHKYAKVDNNSSDDSEEPSSPVSGPGSSRTSTRYHSQRHDSKASSLTSASSDDILRENTKRNSIPWPDLVKLSPGNLKRTASHLMKEWEKTLTPPPESRVADHSSGDYVGRSTTPPDLL